MLDDVLIAEFQPPSGHRVRLYRVLDDAYAWYDYENLTPGGNRGAARAVITALRKDIQQSLKDGHLVASFVLKVFSDGHWAPLDGFAIVNDTASVSEVRGDRVTGILESRWPFHAFPDAGPRMDPAFLESILFWTVFELCGLDADEDIFSRMLFQMQIPSPVEDTRLSTWAASEGYQTLHRLVQQWKAHPPKPKQQEKRVNELIEWAEVVLGECPTEAVRYDDWVASPMQADTQYDDAIELAVTFEGSDQYIAGLFLFDDDHKPSEPWWAFMVEGFSPVAFRHPYFLQGHQISSQGKDASDLLTALLASRLVLPASRYEAWMDAHTAVPIEVFTSLDTEPWLLLGTRIPWLWSAEEARPFFSALEGG